mmetsp:Transcript_30287/g.87302  ORF Transcript_30287/g.87302 Transcript_30287/m.87302 type:complete len:271 (-) Transcript_30287:152-964(-)
MGLQRHHLYGQHLLRRGPQHAVLGQCDPLLVLVHAERCHLVLDVFDRLRLSDLDARCRPVLLRRLGHISPPGGPTRVECDPSGSAEGVVLHRVVLGDLVRHLSLRDPVTPCRCPGVRGEDAHDADFASRVHHHMRGVLCPSPRGLGLRKVRACACAYQRTLFRTRHRPDEAAHGGLHRQQRRGLLCVRHAPDDGDGAEVHVHLEHHRNWPCDQAPLFALTSVGTFIGADQPKGARWPQRVDLFGSAMWAATRNEMLRRPGVPSPVPCRLV